MLSANPALPLENTVTSGPGLGVSVLAALEAVRQAEQSLEGSFDPLRAETLTSAVQILAESIRALPHLDRRSPWVKDTLSLAKRARLRGVFDWPSRLAKPVAASDEALPAWAACVLRILTTPCWEVARHPAFTEVPDWLWGDYAAWRFDVPPAHLVRPDFVVGRIAAMADLEQWVARNSGSAAVRAAVEAFREAPILGPSGIDRSDWKAYASARGRLLQRLRYRDSGDFEPVLSPRNGRQLRVGVLFDQIARGPDIDGLLPILEHLCRRSFSINAYSLKEQEAECDVRWPTAIPLHLLPEPLAERLAALRMANLDVLIFVGPIAYAHAGVAELAQYRIAGVQVVNDRAGVTTGCPLIDLAVAGGEPPAAESALFTERIGVLSLPLPAGAEGSLEFAATVPARSALGIPENGPLVVTVIDESGVSAATLAGWCRLLELAPASHLALAVVHQHPAYSHDRMVRALSNELVVRGLESSRLSVFPVQRSRCEEVLSLLRVADVVIDAGSALVGSWSALQALRLGTLVVAPQRQVGDVTNLLGAAGLSGLSAVDDGAAASAAASLLAEVAERDRLRLVLRERLEDGVAFLDGLAASDAMGALLEAAYDELASLGSGEFRRQSELVRCFTVPDVADAVRAGFAALDRGDVEGAAVEAGLALRAAPRDRPVRHLVGEVLRAQSDHTRSVAYLLAVVQSAEAAPEVWISLGRSLRQNGQHQEAIQALEVCLRRYGPNPELLFLLLDLSEEVGATEMSRDILQCLRDVAPHDPRVVAMS